MRHALILTSALVGLLAASPALAQSQPERSGEAAGLRYLGWSGRTTDTAARGPQAAAAADGLRRPASVIPHAGAGMPPVTRVSARPSRTPDRVQRAGLTPASAWLSPEAEAPSPAPYVPQSQPEYLPEPVRAAPIPVAPTPQRPAPEPPRREAPAPAAAPVQPQPQPQPQPQAPQPTVPQFDPTDPMAPRRDAPIFRMQQPGSAAAQPMPEQPAAQAETPQAQRQPSAPQPTQQLSQVNTGQPTQTARYYSVHRPTGRQPDPVVLPDQVYLEALQLTELPVSADLAEPQPGPTLMRNGEGRMVSVPDQDPQ